MALDLTKYGITGTTEIIYNPSYEDLYKEEMKPELTGFDKGVETELKAVNVMTGIYTGRSPKDKYIVMDANSRTLFGGHLMSTRTITILWMRRHGALLRISLRSSFQARDFS